MLYIYIYTYIYVHTHKDLIVTHAHTCAYNLEYSVEHNFLVKEVNVTGANNLVAK